MSKKPTLREQFVEVSQRVIAARQNALQSANTVLLDLYWQIGEYISNKITAAEWAENVVEQLAQHLAHAQPVLRGFTYINLLRMRQFYETYKDHKKVAVLVKLLPWAHHLIILNRSKSAEEREFYLRMALQEGWSSHELGCQFKSNLFERVVLLPRKVVPMMLYNANGIAAPVSDDYIFEFLGLPPVHTETNLRRMLVQKLKSFFIELGYDFCFIQSEFPLQISEQDFILDLLFFHRGLNALLAIELKVGEFEPSHLEQLSFYLKILNDNVKQTHEQPSIGLLICVNKKETVIEYTFHNTLLPTDIAECKTYLPSRRMLHTKLNEFYIEEEDAVLV
ncbi:MAG: hypothetical protein K0R48_99 [Gammaproteobacteria bacterium]|jgi:predicted nuclease of restriction endonuclease-like (RecB) superfamily|nr:hypothetical protein [Gammaproteobacteria bacterium]